MYSGYLWPSEDETLGEGPNRGCLNRVTARYGDQAGVKCSGLALDGNPRGKGSRSIMAGAPCNLPSATCHLPPQALFCLANGARLSQCWPMQSHELLREVFQKCSPKQVSANLGLSLSMIYKWAEPGDPTAGSGSTNPLDRIDALIKCTDDTRLVQWICQRAGGFFIRNPKTTHPHPSYLIPATNEIVQEFADLLAVVAAAAADNQITQKESQQIRARWEELKSVTETFVACCEEGNFRPLKERQMGSPTAEVRSPITDGGSGRGLLDGSTSSGKAGDVKR